VFFICVNVYIIHYFYPALKTYFMSKSKFAQGINSLLGGKTAPDKPKGLGSFLQDDKEEQSLPDPPTAPTVQLNDEVEGEQLTATGDENVKPLLQYQLQGVNGVRTIGARKARGTYMIPADMIYDRDGFNVRYDLGDIRGLAQSLLESGQKTPITVDLVVDETGQLKAYTADGYRRMAAFRLLATEGHANIEVECWVNTEKTTEVDRIAHMFISQDNKQLEPLEVARCFHRLKNLGWNNTYIAKKFGKSEAHVREMLIVANESPDIQDLIIQKKISYTAVVELVRSEKDPHERRMKILRTVQEEGGFTTSHARKHEPKTRGRTQKEPNDAQAISVSDKTVRQFVMPQMKAVSKMAKEFEKGLIPVEKFQKKLGILQKHTEELVQKEERMDRFSKHLLGFYSEETQAQLKPLIDYLEGRIPEEKLLEIK
jgi:ParB-like chromosome segregation protein Spo0J